MVKYQKSILFYKHNRIVNLFKEWTKDFKPMITHVYTLNTTNQLVDINDTYTSFSTMYSVTCDDMQAEFEYAIASQDMLDSKKVHFKKAIGYIEDSVTRNEGKFENWYLVLRASKDTPCKVMLEITSLDVSPPSSPQPQKQGRSQLQVTENFEYNPRPSPPSQRSQQQSRRRPPPKRPVRPRPPHPPPDSDDESDFEENFEEIAVVPEKPLEWWWYALVVLVIILIIVFLLWWFGKLHLLPFYKYFANKKVSSSSTSKVVEAVVAAPLVVAAPSPPAPVVVAPPPPPPPPSTPVVEIPSIEISEPEIFVAPPPPPQLDANFINEMRELKLNF
jgi:hypothetical protein